MGDEVSVNCGGSNALFSLIYRVSDDYFGSLGTEFVGIYPGQKSDCEGTGISSPSSTIRSSDQTYEK